MKPLRFTHLVLPALLMAIGSHAVAQEKTIFKVNGQGVPAAYADTILRNQVARGAQNSPELRGAIENELLATELLAQEAKRRGLDKKPEVQIEIGMMSKRILSQAAINDQLKDVKITEADLKAAYEQAISQQAGRQEFKVSHVLLETEAAAREVIARLDKGEKIASMIKLSKDPGAQREGGSVDLGWNMPNNFVPPFAAALARLTKGKHTTEPVKTEFGYHVIYLEDTRTPTPPPFEQVKGQIQESLLRQRVDALVRDLRTKAKITQ